MQPDSESELTVLSRRLRPALMAYFIRRLRNHAEAEDLTQEVFLRLADKEVSSLEAPEGYVFRMAANLLADRARRNKVRADNTLSILHAETSVDPLDPARVAEGRQSLAALEAALRDLPEPTRSIFILYRLENADRQALGQAYGLSRGQIDRQIAKAMAFLIARVRGNP
jgi:RNA polymerase sigma factor (sigma-70 family)